MSKQKFNKQKTNFTLIANNVINDDRLSLKAIGVFTYMFSKPDNWNFTIKSMCSQMKDGERSIKGAIDELKELGYIVYYKHQDGSGDYHILYEPKLHNEDKNSPKLQNANVNTVKMAERNAINKIDIPNKKDCTKPPRVAIAPEIVSEFEDMWKQFSEVVSKSRKNTDKKHVCLKKYNECFVGIGKKYKDVDDDFIFDFLFEYLSDDWIPDKNDKYFITRLQTRLDLKEMLTAIAEEIEDGG